MLLRKYTIVVSLIFFSLLSEARRKPQSVAGPVRTQLNQVLYFPDQLHKALFEKNGFAVDESSSQLLGVTTQAEEKLKKNGSGFAYIVEVLSSVRKMLVLAQRNPEETRESTYRLVFYNIVQMARNYKLKKYNIFFCSRDRSGWLQSSRRAKNPFSPDTYENCGAPIR